MRALVIERRELSYAAAVVTSRLRPASGAHTGVVRLRDIDPPELPGDGWVRVRSRMCGICGSDVTTVEGRASRYFEPLVSFPFVPGHEVVGELESGARVVIEPVLGHAARGEEPPFPGAAPGDGDDYGHLVTGPLEPGIQIGFCASTSGGWGEEFVAHRSQIHPIPDSLSDEAAVMVEPTAGGVHAALRAGITDGDTVVVLGAGTMGLVTVAAVRRLTPVGTLVVGARYAHQRRLASDIGADVVVEPDALRRAVRRLVGCRVIGQALSGGAEVTIDAVGSPDSIAEAIDVTRPRGRVVLLGMPGRVELDLAPLWHRETELVGSYTYGTEHLPEGGNASAFELAIGLVTDADLARLVTAAYPIKDYRAAIEHAAEAGRRDATKIAFDHRIA
jgi:threonine dehydrogenase-like Zn-dependent dehydrogenase